MEISKIGNRKNGFKKAYMGKIEGPQRQDRMEGNSKNLRDEIGKVMEKNSPSANKTEKGRRSKITIIGDESARNIRSVMRKLLNEDIFSITASIKSNIEAADMTHDLFGVVSDYGPKDYVIFMFGANNTKHVVECKAVQQQKQCVELGVTQGSILDPVLFYLLLS
ncbi:hypothetical protein HHI36_017672 [Cryptolaemus montrouzieri]|uniref:Uncharacterized protein n=1 Tax=Cryptolaemus montrouzieri TaxID=559131 RepID=A0ABD2NNX4_9CUCU